MKLWKRVLVAFLAGTTVSATLPANIFAFDISDRTAVEAYSSTDETEVVASGECGDNATWTLDENGVLTISGTGDMDDYTCPTPDTRSTPWYDYHSNITEVVVEEGITHIGDLAFDYTTITKITLPEGLISIGDSAFECEAITEITLPTTLESIGRDAFALCNSLVEITIPDSVHTIEKYAFYYCKSLEKVTLSNSLEEILDYTFYGCTSLTSILIPDNVSYVSGFAFGECENLTDFQYPSDLSKIEDGSYKRVDTVYVTGTLNYEYAYDVLDIVNEEREAEGKNPLTMDTELMEAAMLRAAEISLYFSHTRALGLQDYTVVSGGASYLSGENIAVGTTTPTNTMNGWMSSSGHKANILSSSYQSIGIGCFYSNGYYYWVQDFSVTEVTEPAEPAQPESNTKTMSVMIDPDLFQDYLNLSKTSVSIDPGESTSVTAIITNSQTSIVRKVKLEPESFTWTSSDTSVATVDASGHITGISPGTATVTAATTTTGKLYRTVEVTVIGKDLSGCAITLSDTEYTYDGTAKEPSVTVIFNGKTLVQDVDYTLTYSSNTTAGTGYAVVTGIEAYSGTVEAAFTIYPVVTPETINVAVGETATITTAGFLGKVYAGFHSGERGVADITYDDNGQLTVTGLKAGTVTAAIYGSGCYTEEKDYLKSYVTITVTDDSGTSDTGDGSGRGGHWLRI